MFERFGLAATLPRRIRSRAKAEADATVIRAGADAAADAIRRRASRRLDEEDIRHQANLEGVAERAVAALPGAVAAHPASTGVDSVDDDWLDIFFASAKGFSNEQMQELWGRLLAGELASPGSFSRRTMAHLRTLDPEDAQWFSALMQLSIRGEDHMYHPIVQPYGASAEKLVGLRFPELKHLEAIGLINFEPIAEYSLIAVPDEEHSSPEPCRWSFAYCGKRFSIQPKFQYSEQRERNVWQIPVGCVLLTSVGTELSTLVEVAYREEAYAYLIETFAEYKPASLLKETDVRREGPADSAGGGSSDRASDSPAPLVPSAE